MSKAEKLTSSPMRRQIMTRQLSLCLFSQSVIMALRFFRHCRQDRARSGCHRDESFRRKFLCGGDGACSGLLPQNHPVRNFWDLSLFLVPVPDFNPIRAKSAAVLVPKKTADFPQPVPQNLWHLEFNPSFSILSRPAAKEKGLTVLMDSRSSPPSTLFLSALKLFQVRR